THRPSCEKVPLSSACFELQKTLGVPSPDLDHVQRSPRSPTASLLTTLKIRTSAACDQAATVNLYVSCDFMMGRSTPLPSDGRMNRLPPDPSRSELKTMCFPSADQAGS